MLDIKTCKDCGIAKPLSGFPKAGKKGRGIRSRCRPCHNERERLIEAAKRALRPSPEVPIARTCKQCGAIRPLEEFPFRRKYGIDYRSYLCRPCYRVKDRESRPSVAKPEWKPPREPFIDPFTGVEMRQCRHCDLCKPLTDYGWRQGKRVAVCKQCCAEIRKARYDANPEKERQRAVEYAKRNPQRASARFAVTLAVRKREMPRARELQCRHCGDRAADYHHYLGYESEHWLSVIPLCKNCHRSTQKGRAK